MPLQKLIFKPGVNRENTRYTNEGAWWDMDKIRFRSGTPEKIGGWVQNGTGTFRGTARHLHSWITLGGLNLLSVGSELKMYLELYGGTFDITPIRATIAAVNNPFLTGAAGSAIVTVHIVAHGAIIGDFVTFAGATTTDGILDTTLNAEFQVLTYVDADHFTITATACSAGATNGGGAGVTGAFQPTTGLPVSISGTGFGVSPWGFGGWGAAYTSTALSHGGIKYWLGDNWGEDFVYAIRDGALYYWSAVTQGINSRGVLLSGITGATDVPAIVDNVLVTLDEHVVAVGCSPLGVAAEDPLLVRWCDQGNALNWTPGITSTAGDARLTAGSYTYAVKRMRQENLIWTDTALVSMQFVGPPVIFSFTTLAENTSIASINSVGVANNVAYWMGNGKFYVYDGAVKTLPCSVRKYVFGDFNLQQGGQVTCGVNHSFNEVTWFYCSALSLTVDQYVTYNYLEDLWTFGHMTRSAWIDSSLRPYPMAAGLDGYLYQHEYGVDDGSVQPYAAIPAYLESGDFDIGDGQNFSFVERVIPDVDFSGSTSLTPSVTITLQARNGPGDNFTQTSAVSAAQTSTVPFGQFTEQAWTRIRGRQMIYRIESTAAGVTWQQGTPRLGIREDGQR